MSAFRAGDGGEVDPFFLTGPGFSDSVQDVAIQPDGKVIAVGVFVRLNVDGSVDTTFRAVSSATGAQAANATGAQASCLREGEARKSDYRVEPLSVDVAIATCRQGCLRSSRALTCRQGCLPSSLLSDHIR